MALPGPHTLMTRSHRCCTPTPRSSIWAMLLLVLLGQGAATHHLVTTHHAYCPTHDAVVDTEAGHSHHGDEPAAAGGAPALRALAADEEHGDHHCVTVPGIRRGPPSRGPAMAAPEPVHVRDDLERLEPTLRGPSIPLYRIAPNNSPPSA